MGTATASARLSASASAYAPLLVSGLLHAFNLGGGWAKVVGGQALENTSGVGGWVGGAVALPNETNSFLCPCTTGFLLYRTPKPQRYFN